MTHFKSLAVKFVRHRIIHCHQKEVKSGLISLLALRDLFLGIDYASAWEVRFKCETQAQYASRMKLHILVIIAHFKSDAGGLITESYFVFTDDGSHDAYFLSHAIDKILPLVREDMLSYGVPPGLSSVFIHSDGDPKAFRYCDNFALLSELPHRFDTSCGVNWNFAEAAHGKGLWDGEGGAVKTFLEEAVVSEEIVFGGDPITQAVDFLEANFRGPNCPTRQKREQFPISKRTFVGLSASFRKRQDIEHFDTLAKTKTNYCYFGKKGMAPREIGFRQLSCACEYCMQADFSSCRNAAVVGGTKKQIMRPAPPSRDRAARASHRG
jgi:hypothetical protein